MSGGLRTSSRRELDRRDFLRLAGLTAGAHLLGTHLVPGRALAQERTVAHRHKTKHVIFVAFAGGVRSRDTIGTPENVPNLMKIAKEGVILTRLGTRYLGHYGSALALFTGQAEEKAAKDPDRSSLPTMFEYVRKQQSLDARQVWLATSGGDQQLNYAYGSDPEYGARYGASLVGGDGLFNSDWKGLTDKFGRPKTEDPKERERVDELQRALEPPVAPPADDDSAASDEATRRRVERTVLDEIGGATATLTGTGAGDARAIRAAKSVILAYRPALVAIALSNADVAHGSAGAYIEVLKRNDQEIGALWQAVQSDPELKGTTTLIVCPEFGRDTNPNKSSGLDHADSSVDLLEVACFAVGPDFRREAVIRSEGRTTQLCPTICELLGVEATKTKEKPIREMFA